jgi:GNAT superfamily N-acetyltransferase
LALVPTDTPDGQARIEASYHPVVATRPDPPIVRRATTADVAAITEMLVRAFDDDPVANYMFAGHRRRRRGLRSFFSTELGRHYLPSGHVYTTDDLSGAALWGPPGRERHPVQELLELLPTAPYLLSPHVLGALRLMFTVEGLHPKESHWYLFTLGTAPERQGKGVGSALLRSVLSHVDREGQPAYLESSKERNVPLYARFGFEVIDVLPPTWGSPTLWRMWREPRLPDQ